MRHFYTKNFNLVFFIFLLSMTSAHALDDQPGSGDITDQPTTDDTTKTNDTPSTTKTFTDNQLLLSWSSTPKNDRTRYNTPLASQFGMMSIGGGFKLSDLPNLFNKDHYPSGNLFFPDGKHADSFDALKQAIEAEPIFYAYLKELYSTVLQQLYAHLKKIFTTFNRTNIEAQDFLKYEQEYAFNTKATILMHLINIVDSQSYKFSQALFSKLPKSVAVFASNTLLRNDANINLSLLTLTRNEITALIQSYGKTQEETERIISNIIAKQTTYKTIFKQYFDFFRGYTGDIILPAPNAKHPGENLLAYELTTIRSFIKSRSKDQPIIPQFFFPSKGTIRAVQLIPVLAKRLENETKLIGWPQAIVTAANNGTPARNSLTKTNYSFSLAYFKEGKLFVHMPTGSLTSGNQPQLFEQELLKQPTWLNSEDTILKVTQACLGDFTTLIGMNILEPEIEGLITQIRFS